LNNDVDRTTAKLRAS